MDKNTTKDKKPSKDKIEKDIKVKKIKKKIKKNITSGIALVNTSFNNSIITYLKTIRVIKQKNKTT